MAIANRNRMCWHSNTQICILTAAIYRAAGSLAGACAAKDRLTALGRLDAKQQQLQALRQSIDAIAPVLKFEDSLKCRATAELATSEATRNDFLIWLSAGNRWPT